MIPYQIDQTTYLIPDKWYWHNLDKLSFDRFNQEVIMGNFDNLELEDSYDATIDGDNVKINNFEKYKTDKTERIIKDDIEE